MGISQKKRFEILKRDNFVCRYCGAKAPDVFLQIDHVIAKSKGGSDDITNLISACEDCNRGKSNKPLDKPVEKVQLEKERERFEQEKELQDFIEEKNKYWMEKVEKVHKFYQGSFLKNREVLTGGELDSIKYFVQRLGISECIASVDITYDKFYSESCKGNHFKESNCRKYFFGVLNNKLRDNNNG